VLAPADRRTPLPPDGNQELGSLAAGPASRARLSATQLVAHFGAEAVGSFNLGENP